MIDNDAKTDARNIRTVKDIVGCYLIQNGFDGLHLCDECGCGIDDLFSCGYASEECAPGYKIETSDGGWIIGGKR